MDVTIDVFTAPLVNATFVGSVSLAVEMFSKLFVFLTILVLSHSAINAASAEEMYVIVDRVEPAAGRLMEISLGEKIVSIERGEFRDCLVPKMEHTKSVLGAIYYIAANEPICKKTSTSKKFEPQYINYNYGASSSMMPVTFRQKKDGTYHLCVRAFGIAGTCAKDLTEDEVLKGPYFVHSNGVSQKAIEFRGLSGDSLQLAYIESSDAWKTENISSEFSWELAQGSVVTYRDFRFEVLEVNNTSLSYKLLSEKGTDQRRSQPTSPDSASSDEPADSIESRLRKLQSLYQMNLITEEEYSKKKQELLEQL